ncbi:MULTISPECIES: hypothetical protein [Enterobacteriaceae]|uniref:hypothetical protein n=1 Tax=Enterobacteriaceae TaxID=543 RepID=UPI0004D7A7A9|nr:MULTISPECIES: hypothetical protein [Enterobacteriaceae]KDY19405.1 hypothetical protein AD00_2294 [Escherichia coli 2-316-03_S4_C2]MDM2817939.1 hypothetical protein [Citrobacter sp. Cpo102]
MMAFLNNKGLNMWLGIPFLYVKERVADTISIDKIATVSVDSSFSWETIIAAFISGLVPALISLYVIRQNNESVRYQQSREDKRNYAAHVRINVSEYAYQLTKVHELHTEWLREGRIGYSFTRPDIEKKMSDALLELEKYKVSLLISILEDEKGCAFKKSINDIHTYLSTIIKKHISTMENSMGWTGRYSGFISDANKYLND